MVRPQTIDDRFEIGAASGGAGDPVCAENVQVYDDCEAGSGLPL